MELFNNICLIAAIVICCGAFYKNYETKTAPINKKASKNKSLVQKEIPQKLYLILLGIIVLVALFIRIYKFGSVPGGFNQDGAMAAVDGKALADYGTDRYGMKLPVHLTAWGYGQMSALLSYLMVPFIKLFFTHNRKTASANCEYCRSCLSLSFHKRRFRKESRAYNSSICSNKPLAHTSESLGARLQSVSAFLHDGCIFSSQRS